MSLKRPHSPPAQDVTDLFASAPIEDRDSTFVGYFSPTLAPKALQARPECKSASHRILAWRTRSKQLSLHGEARPRLEFGHDDDGEKYGGKHVAKILDEESVEGSVVVARWYGGTMLGPVRFTWMEKAAREAVVAWKEEEQETKRRKLEEDEKKALIDTLAERDESVTVLRELLASKRNETNGSQTSPAKTVDYTKMDVVVLKRLERARDQTISLLLRKIDEAEKNPGDNISHTDRQQIPASSPYESKSTASQDTNATPDTQEKLGVPPSAKLQVERPTDKG